MDGYGIEVGTVQGVRQYSGGGEKRWDLGEAERKAYELLTERAPWYVTVADGKHEFRMWRPDFVDRPGGFDHGQRWAEWYVDAEINGNRWIYRPLADLNEYGDADYLAEEAAGVDEVTHIWVGRSDGSEEEEWPVRH